MSTTGHATSAVASQLAAMTVAEKCSILAGVTWWRTPPVERLGIPQLKMSDGPNGVRGEGFGEDATPAVLLPAGIVQGATWDPALIGRVGDLLGREARRRQAHVLLAPSVNLHRTPVGGRTFEYYSEDPELTARLAVASVRAIQSHGVAATVKHLVANDTEVDRFTVDVRVDERVLRELYLRPFEAAVREAGVWAVMSAYNRLDGDYCSANHRLLTTVLREQWGFDGAVISDWYGAHDTEGCAAAGMSLEMPAPARVYGDKLAKAVSDGRVEEVTVDRLAADVLGLIERTEAVQRHCTVEEISVDDPVDRALCREVAVAGTVLAKNDGGLLPIAASPDLTVALIGPNAAATRTGGGGSASLRPLPQATLVDALRRRFANVIHEPGVTIDKFTPLATHGRLVGPDGEPGLVVTFHNGTSPSAPAAAETRSATGHLRFAGSLPPGVTTPCVLTVSGAYLPEANGEHEFGLVSTGAPNSVIGGHTLTVGGERLPIGDAYYGLGSTEQLLPLRCDVGQPVPIDIEVRLDGGFAALRLGVRRPRDADMFDRAVRVAGQADVAVVVVGTNDEWETEGSDRSSLSLPGRQDELVSAVAAANSNTVVVVNTGSPASMPWVDAVSAVLIPFFGGMEMSEAVADILTGAADPGGRLPITFPRSLDDVASWPHYPPRDGRQTYGEGFLIGYRGFDAQARQPLFPFGHGLSYGHAEWGPVEASARRLQPGGEVTVSVAITGDVRDATVVVQGYVAPVRPPVVREPKALRTWRKLVVAAHDTVTVELNLAYDDFRRWDTSTDGWVVDPGDYDLVIAASATDVRGTVRVTVS